jgi:hypothetical protein
MTSGSILQAPSPSDGAAVLFWAYSPDTFERRAEREGALL